MHAILVTTFGGHPVYIERVAHNKFDILWYSAITKSDVHIIQTYAERTELTNFIALVARWTQGGYCEILEMSLYD